MAVAVANDEFFKKLYPIRDAVFLCGKERFYEEISNFYL